MTYLIRQARPDDAEKMLDYLRVIADEPNNGTSLSSSDDLKQTVEKQIEINTEALNSHDRIIFIAQADSQIIGLLNCANKDGGYVHTFSLGVTVRKEWRDQGVGTAMMKRLIQWCEANTKCHRLELQVFSNNPRAIYVYQKLGFVHEGVRKESFYKKGQFLDLVYMAILFDR
jgi:RimJ/RimL family protein N-acetyltransferase